MFSYSGPQNELSNVYMSWCFSYFDRTDLDVPSRYSLIKKLQSLKEKPLNSLLTNNGNIFPYLGLKESWQP